MWGLAILLSALRQASGDWYVRQETPEAKIETADLIRANYIRLNFLNNSLPALPSLKSWFGMSLATMSQAELPTHKMHKQKEVYDYIIK